MAARDYRILDGTTGRGDHGGRRSHIIRLLRDTKEPLTVEQVARRVDLSLHATRYHLESLVDSGLAVRESEARTTPGRPKVTYRGTLPSQTHERAEAFRLLAELMAMTVAKTSNSSGEWMYQVGSEWGKCLMSRATAGTPSGEGEAMEQLVDKLDALWFAPEWRDSDPATLVLYNCPFLDSARRCPQVICQLHAGMINGSLEGMGSQYRLVHLRAQASGHKCEGGLQATTARLTKVPLEVARAA